MPDGNGPAMAAPREDEGVPALAEVAAETPEESTAKEIEAVGDGPDEGDFVPPDDSQ